MATKEVPSHVLYFSNHLRGPHGNAGARTWHQVRQLSETTMVTVIIPTIDPVASTPVTAENYAGIDTNKVHVKRAWCLPNFRKSKLSRLLYFASVALSNLYLGIRSRNISCVVTMSLPLSTMMVATLIAKIKRVPLVIDVRDLPFETAQELGYLNNKYVIKLCKSLENACFTSANKITTNSPRYVKPLVSFGVNKEDISLALIGYDDFNNESELICRTKYWSDILVKEGSFYLTYAGTLGHAFPLDKLLSSLNNINNDRVKLLVIGDGQRKAEYEAFTSANDIPVLFVGRVTKLDVHAILQLSDLCVYVGSEGKFSSCILGNKIFDYLGSGTPVLYIGPDSAVTDLLTQTGGGVQFSGNDIQGITDKISTLATDHFEYRNLKNEVSNFHNLGYTAKNSAKIFSDVVHKLTK